MVDPLLIVEARDAVKSGRAAVVRRASHLAQSDVARILGVTTSAVCKWEGGTRLPRADVATEYARLLRRLESRAAAP